MSGAVAWRRRAWADVDLDAIRSNAASLASLCAPAAVCAVVKADGYGHGAAAVARAALDGGATWLAVALVEEGIALREAGIPGDVPVLVLSEPAPDAMADAVGQGLRPAVYTRTGAAAVIEAARSTGRPALVHVKVDTGMHRVGVRPESLGDVLEALDAGWPDVVVDGLLTHFAVADEPERDAFTAGQLDRFLAAALPAADRLEARGRPRPVLHAANSAGLLGHERARLDVVRSGIALYGVAPARHLAPVAHLRPALSLHAAVSHVQVVPAGEGASYGLRWVAPTDRVVATVPLGYADGVPRRLSSTGGEVLVHGRRRPIAGTITMDQLLVDCGPAGDPGAEVAVGDDVVLIGRQGADEITADEWAERLGTISYEVLCGIGPRVQRRYGAGS